MGRFDTIKTAIDANINTNGNQEITGSVLNAVLDQMVDATDKAMTDLSEETDGKLTELSARTGAYEGKRKANTMVFSSAEIPSGNSILVSFTTISANGNVIVMDAQRNILKRFQILNGSSGQVFPQESYSLPSNYHTVEVGGYGDVILSIKVDNLTAQSLNKAIVEQKAYSDELSQEIKEVSKDLTIVADGEEVELIPFRTDLDKYIYTNNGSELSSAGSNIANFDVSDLWENTLVVTASVSANSVVGYQWIMADGTIDTSTLAGQGYADHRLVVPVGASTLRFSYLTSKGISAHYRASTRLKDAVVANTNAINELRQVVGIGKKSAFLRASGNLASGASLSLGEMNICTNRHLVFVADIVEMGVVRLGYGRGKELAAYIEVDDTELRVYRGTSTTAATTQQHKLTIANNLQITIDVGTDKDATPTIRIVSNGNSYTYKHWTFSGNEGEIFAESVSANLSNCVLSWTCEGWGSDVHIYGDSYLGYTSTSRWARHLLNDGYTDCLLDAFGGRTSSQALPRFKDNIMHSSPKYALWLMGMNDNDSASSANVSWLACIQEFIDTCLANNIEPILSTIPNTPTLTHIYKNTWVRESGYRYIDCAMAVGAESQSAPWYTGMLSSDNVHPTEQGAMALYMQVLADFPEIMLCKAD